jgi:hypothetical protein
MANIKNVKDVKGTKPGLIQGCVSKPVQLNHRFRRRQHQKINDQNLHATTSNLERKQQPHPIF